MQRCIVLLLLGWVGWITAAPSLFYIGDSCTEEAASSTSVEQFCVDQAATISLTVGNETDPCHTTHPVSWFDVCDVQNKSCGLAPMNCEGFNTLEAFLSLPGPMFGDGWTLYINPFEETCGRSSDGLTTTCTEYNATSPTGKEIHQWKLPVVHSDYNDITIKSLYGDRPVQFHIEETAATVNYVAGYPPCVQFVFHGKGIQLEGMNFVSTECSNGSYVDPDRMSLGNAAVPIQFLSSDASNTKLTNLRAEGAFAIALFMPDSTTTNITIQGTKMHGLMINDPLIVDDCITHSFISILLYQFIGNATIDSTVSAVWYWKAPNGYPHLSGTFKPINVSQVLSGSPQSLGCPACLSDEDKLIKQLGINTKDKTTVALVIVLVVIMVIFIIALCVHFHGKHYIAGVRNAVTMATHAHLMETTKAEKAIKAKHTFEEFGRAIKPDPKRSIMAAPAERTVSSNMMSTTFRQRKNVSQ